MPKMGKQINVCIFGLLCRGPPLPRQDALSGNSYFNFQNDQPLVIVVSSAICAPLCEKINQTLHALRVLPHDGEMATPR